LSAPTGAQRAVLAETKSDLAAIEKEIKSRWPEFLTGFRSQAAW
jgi:hypothetical protein